jgi:hypothetical protein
MRPDDSAAAYKVGMALHFLMDVCKPMHAGNFTPLFGDPADGGGLLRDSTGRLADWRHPMFEAMAHKTSPKPVMPLGDVTVYPTIEALLDDASMRAHTIFRETVQPVARAKLVTAPDGSKSIGPGSNLWSEAEVAAVLARSVPLAQHAIASFLILHDRLRAIRSSLPAGMTRGREGKWVFRGSDGSWWPGATQENRGARVAEINRDSISFAGAYDFMWGTERNRGELRIDIGEIDAIGHATVQIRHRCTDGNLWGERDLARGAGMPQGEWRQQTTAVHYGRSADGLRVEYHDRAGSQLVLAQQTMQRTGWQPGVEFEIRFFGETHHVTFELRG